MGSENIVRAPSRVLSDSYPMIPPWLVRVFAALWAAGVLDTFGKAAVMLWPSWAEHVWVLTGILWSYAFLLLFPSLLPRRSSASPSNAQGDGA